MSSDGGPRAILGAATQLGFVVRDLDAAVRHWIDVIGVRPFLFLERGTGRPPMPARYRGEEVQIEIRLAFGLIGDVQLELIQQVNDAPSPYRDFLASGREGLQHQGYFTDDHDEACRRLETNGYSRELVIEVPEQAHPIIYYRSPGMVGPMLEIVPARWQKARQAVNHCIEGWTGDDPLIRHDTYAAFLTDTGVVFD